MREQSQTHFVGIDIGTQFVRCVVGNVEENDPAKISVIGHGQALNTGMRKGVVVQVDEVVDAVVRAVTEAERISGVQIQHATVNVNGSHVLGLNSRGVVAISGADKTISEDDRMRVEEAATIVQLPTNREIIQVFANNYRLDGQDNLKDPIGMRGVRLEVDTHIVTALTPNIRSLDMLCERAKIDDPRYTVSSLAAAEAVLNRQQKESGTLLLDIGAGTTNMAVIEDGEVYHVGILPVGGINITNDLAIGLKTDLDVAEKVKTEAASLNMKHTSKSVKIEHEGEEYFFEPEEIKIIVESRVEELFELVDKELKKINRSRKLPGGVVLVGGTAKLPGIELVAKEKLQLAARLGHLQPLSGLIDTVEDSQYSCAVGLMILDVLLYPSRDMSHPGKPNKSVFGLVEGIFRKIRL
jgi:cell division protein FtsA